MKKIGIVILNYLAYEDTLECISSIQHQTLANWELIVVDNFSTNSSFEAIKLYCNKDSRITVLRTKENLGFARGNNFGIDYLKSKKIFRVLCVNGDTVFENINYLNYLSSLELPSNCAMVGTKIYDKVGVNQNLELAIHKKTFKRWLYNRSRSNSFPFFFKIWFQILFEIQRLTKLTKPLDRNKDIYQLNLKNCMLHGAAIMFSENYLKDYCGFYPKTFLYLEEDFLNIICQKLGFIQAYIPNIYIRHKEDSSTKKLFKGNIEKENNYKNMLIKDSQELLKSLKKMNSEEIIKTLN